MKLRVRERPELARHVFALHEAGWEIGQIAAKLGLSQSNVVNLIGYGRRLAAGQGVPLAGEPS